MPILFSGEVMKKPVPPPTPRPPIQFDDDPIELTGSVEMSYFLFIVSLLMAMAIGFLLGVR